MMLKIANGKCIVDTFKKDEPARVYMVFYKNNFVYVNIFQGLKIGKYTRAYIIDEKHNLYCFGEIKFTTGIFTDGRFYGNYVLCEY